MSKGYIVVNNETNVVENFIVADPSFEVGGCTLIERQENMEVDLGWIWNGQTFDKSPEAKQREQALLEELENQAWTTE